MLKYITNEESTDQTLFMIAELKKRPLIIGNHKDNIHKSFDNEPLIMKNDSEIIDVGTLNEYSSGNLNDKINKLIINGYEGAYPKKIKDDDPDIFIFEDELEPIYENNLFLTFNPLKGYTSTFNPCYMIDELLYSIDSYSIDNDQVNEFYEKTGVSIIVYYKELLEELYVKLNNTIETSLTLDDLFRIEGDDIFNIHITTTGEVNDLFNKLSVENQLDIVSKINRKVQTLNRYGSYVINTPYYIARVFPSNKLFTSFEKAEEYAKTLELGSTAHIYSINIKE